MMNKILVPLFMVIFLITLHDGVSQTNKKFKGKRHTSRRELERRIREGEERNQTEMPFAMAQESNTKRGAFRDDFMWKAETGNTIYEKAGNVSIVEPSKYGLREGLEIQSHIPILYWIPNVFVKKRWVNKNWYLSTRHGLYSATSGLNYAQKNGYYDIVDSSSTVPFILSLKNEILFSKTFNKDYSCHPNQPTWILNAGVGIDFGIPINGETDLNEIDGHFISNRSAALIGDGYSMYVFGGSIFQMGRNLFLDGSLKYFHGTFSGHNALEQQTRLEYFINYNFSVTGGYKLSFANYSNINAIGIIPMIDISWYFGKKQGRENGLFDRKMR